MISDLKILNGTLDYSFDPYIYEYTVVVDNDINELEFEYVLSDEYDVLIKDNVLNNYENIVYLIIYSKTNIEEEYTYSFTVYKENIDYSSKIDNYISNIEVNNNKFDDFNLREVQYLSIGIFLSIIILFSIIFKRKVK